MPQRIVYVPGSTRKVCQLTGEFDRERNQYTVNQTRSRFGLTGTDLGASFEHEGRIYFLFGDTGASVDAVTMIQSNIHAPDQPGNLEVIARVGERLVFFWREAGPNLTWHGPFGITVDGIDVTGVSGNPALIQSSFGIQGNFDVLVPRASEGLAFYARLNDEPDLRWTGPTVFGEKAGYHNQYRPDGGDSIAYTEDTNPEDGVTLQFITAPDGHYYSPQVLGPTGPISLGVFEVPTGGFSAGGKMYVFFTTTDKDPNPDRSPNRYSFLARLDDASQNRFTYLYELSRDKFSNFVVPVLVQNGADFPGLPAGQGVWLWGSGKPLRKTSPHLAYLPLNTVEDRRTLRYFAGTVVSSGQPIWSTQQEDARPLFEHPYVGELSVIWNQFLHKWLMLYNCGNPRGINFRVADQPWGPWSSADVLFDPWRDDGYCHFMHAHWDFRICDWVYDPGRAAGPPENWGGEYAPCIVSRYTTGDATSTTIYYVMSTWNPYNTVLMKSTLQLELH